MDQEIQDFGKEGAEASTYVGPGGTKRPIDITLLAGFYLLGGKLPPKSLSFTPKDFEDCHSTNLKMPHNLPGFPPKMNLHSRFLPQNEFSR